jgi:ABC-2 type transport system ATP-binding protein
MQDLISVVGLTKKYGQLLAVDHVDLSIGKGICFGLLGPNGAGKTTLVEMIEDIIDPTSGTIFYEGSPRSASFRQAVGIMFQRTALLSYLTVQETLRTFADLYEAPEEIDILLRRCHLMEIQKRLNDKISGGQRQRLLLALALVNRPRLLFLDEPSTGLDPQARRNLWDIIMELKGEGKTIVLTTHYMEEAQALCDEIAIMDRGRIMTRGTPAQLISDVCAGATITLPSDQLGSDLEVLGVPVVRNGDRLSLHCEDVNRCIQVLISKGVDLSEMTVRTPNLEDLFLNLTGRRLRD